MDGLLEGRHAVTHHLGMEFLGATGAIPVHARVVDDGNLVSGGGVTSGLDLALYLVTRE
jgi:transcriptional regulator GlxA family with amidase domain